MKRERRNKHRSTTPADHREHTKDTADRELWHHVARTVEPLRAKQRVAVKGAVSEPAKTRIDNGVSSVGREASITPTEKAKPSKKAEPPSRSPEKQTRIPPPQPLNRRQLRKLSSSRTAIDARLDLHGMRQQEAHDALLTFVLKSSAAGHRTVLVITGKGRTATSHAEAPDIVSERQEHGVLRRRVPAWLRSDPAIAPHVIALTEATQRHGGSGAFYVTLRTKAGKQ